MTAMIVKEIGRRVKRRGATPQATAEYGRPAWAEIHDCRQDPLSSSGRYRRSARRQMRQAKPAMLTEVDMRASMSKS